MNHALLIFITMSLKLFHTLMVYMYTGTVYTFQCYKQMVVRNQACFVASGAEGGTLACSGGHVCIAARSQ